MNQKMSRVTGSCKEVRKQGSVSKHAVCEGSSQFYHLLFQDAANGRYQVLLGLKSSKYVPSHAESFFGKAQTSPGLQECVSVRFGQAAPPKAFAEPKFEYSGSLQATKKMNCHQFH